MHHVGRSGRKTLLWLELLSESGLVDPLSIRDLTVEADELVAIFASARKTAKGSQKESANQQISKSANGS
jgi:hypothetical protein